MVETANTIWADGPSSNPSQPQKSLVRQWGTKIEQAVDAFTANGGLIYDTKAHMDGDLAHGANASAWVIGDATPANNGIYRKLDVSGSGSWSRIADLPYSYILASNAGAGTANAIVATTAIPLPSADGGALVALPIVATNTGSPVTVAFNGGGALTIKSNSGNDLVAGGVVAGMVVAGYKVGTTFRLLSDQPSAAIQAASEAAAAAAAASAAEAEGYITGALTGDIIGAATDKAATPAGVFNYVKQRFALTPEDFGAVAITDWDTPEDSTAALAALVDAVNTGNQPILLKGFYKTTETLAFTCNSLAIAGASPAQSGFLFADCDGITLTQDEKKDTFSLRDMTLMTDQVNTRKCFVYANSATKDRPAELRNLHFTGEDYFVSGGSDQGWLEDVNLTHAQYTYLSALRFMGRGSDITDGAFPTDTVCLSITDSLQVYVSECSLTRKKTGLKIRGFSEGVDVSRSIFLANDIGIDSDAEVGESDNDLNVVGNHFASYTANLKLAGVAVSATSTMHFIRGNLFFAREVQPVDGFNHIIMNGAGIGQVVGNHFYQGGITVDAKHTCVSLIDSNDVLINGNFFHFCCTLVRTDADCERITIANNFCYDTGPTSALAPLVDAGTSTEVHQNFGTRKANWTAQFIKESGSRFGAVVSLTGQSSAVNYIDLLNGPTGTGVAIRAIGTDTDIDLLLQGKGAGLVRATKTLVPNTSDGMALGNTSLQWSDAFLASGGVINWANGNYTITHSTGKLTFNGAVLTTGVGGVGYATGAGGTVTQATSKSTGVTLSKPSGQITMNGAALAAATIVSFTLTNTAIAAGDVLVLNHISGGTAGAYTINAQCAAGSATITIRNNTAGSLSEAIVLAFALVKAVTS